MTDNAPILLTMGDPAGCGPQITAHTWQLRAQHGLPPFAVVTDSHIYGEFCDVVSISDLSETNAIFDKGLPVIQPKDLTAGAFETGVPSETTAAGTIASIQWATQAALDGNASAVVTNPISKAVLYEAGFSHPGHTEFIADICNAAAPTADVSPIMMLVGGGLKVALATIHVPLSEVALHLTKERLHIVAKAVHAALRTDFGIESPRIAFTGLNPHAGENGSIGREEVDIINPAASKLRNEGIIVSYARPADTVFHEALSGLFDAVIAMTHDQGLIPVKTLDMWGGVNTTLGLPIVRTSPDHGTAYEAARDRTCRPDSLIAAIKLASTIAANRQNSDHV